MWLLLRTLSLILLVAIGLLLAGQGGWLLDVFDRLRDLLGAGEGTVRHGQGGGGGPAWWEIAGLAAGVLAGTTRPFARSVAQLVTLLHELGHTTFAAAMGARPAGIVLRHDASGHATARWVRRSTPLRRFALAAVAFAGLPAAAATSAAGAQLFRLAGPEPVLWSFAVAGVVVALLARSVWSFLVSAALVVAATAALSDAVEPWAGAMVTGLLAATALRATLDSARALRVRLHPGDDARVVGGHLRLPSRLVQVVQVLLAAVLGAWTVWLLVQRVLGS